MTQRECASLFDVTEKTWRSWEQDGPSELGRYKLKEAGWL